MTLLALVLLQTALAGDAETTAAPAACDAKALQKEMTDASPTAVPGVYVKLAACDPAAAKAASGDAFKRILAGSAANEAAIAALGAGAGETVRTWVAGLEPSDRANTLGWLGEQCKDNAHVETFFVDAQGALGQKFWDDRWFKGLADCRTPKIRTVLQAQVSSQAKPQAGDHSVFVSVLEVYARNVGVAALPTLSDLVAKVNDEELSTYIVSAFADAARVGSGGTDAEAANKAVTELQKLGPTLKPKAVEQARQTLLALGAEQAADSFARYRWPERLADGHYRYRVVAVEKATCKNGKSQSLFHYADFTEPGNQWPEQIQALLPEKLDAEWKLEAAEKCRGTGTLDVFVPAEPFKDEAEATAWLEEQRKTWKSSVGAATAKETAHPAFKM